MEYDHKKKQVDIVILDFKILDTRATVHGETGTFICDLVVQILAYLTDAERKKNLEAQKMGIVAKKERGEWEKQLAKICHEAKEYYESYKNGNVKESTSHKRFLETTKLLLGADSDLCQYLKAVSEDDREMLETWKNFWRILM